MAEWQILLAVFLPLAGAVCIAMAGRHPNLRETVTLSTAIALMATVWTLLPQLLAGHRPEVTLTYILPDLALSFRVEPFGMLFACVASLLWIVNSVYSIGYMRANEERHQTRFYVCFAIALSAAIGIAFAGDLLTLFICYEVLTVSTYPLVAHKGDPTTVRKARVYLGILLASSMGLMLPAMIWTYAIAGTLEFTPGGILQGHVSGPAVGLLLFLYAFGIGKAALMPLHRWLPAAMVAPTPVSALLHAVAVVKAGVFTIVKVVTYIFGLDLLAGTAASDWLVFIAAVSLLMGSIIALTRNNLKERLAYSTVSQLAYVVLGGALANSYAIVGSGMHVAMHAAGKITLFFCAGAIYVAHRKTEISDMDGIGRLMPVTLFAFLIGSLSIIGLPPFGGTWSKWWLGMGALEAGHVYVVAVLMISSLLNVAYLLPIVARAYLFPPAGAAAHGPVRVKEAPLACVIPLSITAALCLVLFFQAGRIETLLASVVQHVPALAGGP